MTRAKNRPVEDRAERVRRPFLEDESADILTVKGTDPDYVYRWVNDLRGRVQRMIDAGYDIVDEKLSYGAESTSGAANTITVNAKHGDKGVLMRIRKEFYEEDQQTRARLIREKEDAIFKREREADGRYGKLEHE